MTNANAIVGYLLGSYHGTLFANGPVAWVEELMLTESVRRQGMATKLTSSAEAWAGSVPAANLAVASRRAGDFSLGIGYEESATYYRKNFVPPYSDAVTFDACPRLSELELPSAGFSPRAH